MSKRVLHFFWMGAYWSVPTARAKMLVQVVSEGRPFNMYDYGTELKGRPSKFQVLKEINAGRGGKL